MTARKCDCGATTDGKWAGKHSVGCASLPEPAVWALAEHFLETTYIAANHQERIEALADVIEAAVLKWMADNPPTDGVVTAKSDVEIRQTENDSRPYREWCRDPAACAGKGYCPLDPTCGD